ncbi:MAG: hypothetical protein AB7O04_10015 [Hyphomonadaceae bacterium]
MAQSYSPESTSARAALADAKGAFENLKDDVQQTARKAKSALRAGVDYGEERIRRTAEGAAHQLEGAHDALADRIRQRPLMYAGGAAAIGVLIGLVLSARR